jgi:hypothetical protein
MANGLFNLKQVVQAVQQGGWPAQRTPSVEYLVVAGGGGGGAINSGGGGAGGLLTGIDPVPNGQTLLVTVGGGGAGGVYTSGWISDPVSGNNSVFGSISTTGGGAGGPRSSGTIPEGGSGGSGGGAGTFGVFSGNNVSGQGNAGGFGGDNDNWTGSGGGGAGTLGISTNDTTSAVPANGGAGIASAINGTVTTYAGGGGGGGRYTGAYSAGGVGGGGGGNGGVAPYSGVNGSTNTGGGGGGGGVGGATGTGGTGGSGIVIVSYPDVYAAATATTGSPTVSTSGSGSIYFDGTGDYLTVPDNSAWAFGSGNFTLEAWVYRTVNTVTQMILAQSDNSTAAGSAWTFYVLSSNKLVSNVYYGSSFITLTSSVDVPTNAWVHVALVRTSGTVSQYINGSRDGTSASLSSNSLNDVAQTVGIGATNAGNDRLTGYLSNIRIIKGSGPYDATASTLTVPTAPLTAITNTQLMLNTVSGALFADSSTNSFTITRNGDVAWNQLSPFTGTGYKNRVYSWTSSGSITF